MFKMHLYSVKCLKIEASKVKTKELVQNRALSVELVSIKLMSMDRRII